MLSPDSDWELTAPEGADLRSFRVVPEPGETPEQTTLAQQAFEALLDRTGY